MGKRPYDLIVAKWPEPQAQVDRQSADDMHYVISIIERTRSIRTELGIPPGAHVDLVFSGDKVLLKEAMRLTDEHAASIRRLARIQNFNLRDAPNQANATFVLNGVTFRIPLEGLIDIEAEKARLTKAAAAAEKDRDALQARLANQSFTTRAKPEAVEKARVDLAERSAEAERLRAALLHLG
jgi:valyl-tRNA synthetase